MVATGRHGLLAAVLRLGGAQRWTSIFFGAANSNGHGKTALYTLPPHPTGTGAWTAGPDIPQVGGQTMVCNDCPGSLLPNGSVLVAAAPFVARDWGSPISFFEYDPVANLFHSVPTPPNNGAQLFWSRFMLLPTGQVLFSPSSNNVQCYTPSGGPDEDWRPTISAVIRHGGPLGTDYFVLKGTQLNGLSQANMYGDDCYASTNFPLVRLHNVDTGEVFYCRTYDFSTLGVATGHSLQSVRFSASHVPHGHYDLCVVANGISSHCVSLCHHRPRTKCCCRETCGCCETETECCEETERADPEIRALRLRIDALQRSVHSLSAHIKLEEPAREPKPGHAGESSQRSRSRG